MLLHQFNSSTYLEGRIKAYWDKYSNEVNALHEKQSKDEDLKGKSLNQWKIMQYYYVMYLMILIYSSNVTVYSLNPITKVTCSGSGVLYLISTCIK